MLAIIDDGTEVGKGTKGNATGTICEEAEVGEHIAPKVEEDQAEAAHEVHLGVVNETDEGDQVCIL